MKKLVLTLIAILAMCGSTMAQHPETYWPDFNGDLFEDQGGLCASLMIDGVLVSNTYENWEMMEIAAFVGDDQHGANIFLTDEMGEMLPTTLGDPVYYTTAGAVVSFKMYNHATGILYEECETLILGGDPITILTGEEHWEIFEDPEHPLILSFTSPAPQPTEFTLDITGYGEGTGNYYLIASPIGQVSPGAVTNMIPTSGGYDLFYFDQTKDNEWINYKEGENSTNSGFSLEPGKGYLYAREVGATLTFTGTPITGDTYNVSLVYDDGDDVELPGWNLIGNPFVTEATLDKPYYRLNGDGSEVKATTEATDINAIEGVFVHTDAAGTATFTKGTGSKSSQTVSLNLVRNDRSASLVDRAIVRFDQGGQLPKFMLDPTNTRVYIPQNGTDYAVATCSDDNIMPVSFKAKENGSYTLKVSIENVEMGYLHLIDNKTGNDVDLLATPSYTFNASRLDYANRFSLVYATTTGLSENFAFFNGSNWFVSNEGKAIIQVVDLTGRILSSESISGNAEISLSPTAGIYMLRLINGDNVKTQKVVVR